MVDSGFTLREFALLYKSLGWSPIVRPSGKRALNPNGPLHNVGVALGERSGDLVNIEFYWREAQELGHELLRTLPSFGTDSEPFRHRFARGKLRSGQLRFEIPPSAAHLFDVDSLVLLEMHGDDCEVALPPSVAPNGESLSWYGPISDPPIQTERELEDNAGIIAALAVVTHAYRLNSDNRDVICEALSGALARAGLHPSDIDLCVEKVAFLALDGEWPWRGTGAAEICVRVDAGEDVMSVAELCQELGIEPMADTLRQWLGIKGRNGGGGQTGGEHHG